jgi:hypothetical protein
MQGKVILRLTVSQSVSLGVELQIFVTPSQLRSFFCVWAPSLMRGWVSLLYTLLALASVVFIGSDSLGTRDHILLSQIRDFPFCHHLRLAGSRWRYSTPPPHNWTNSSDCLLIISWHGPHRAHRFLVSPLVRVRNLLPSNGRCLQSHYLAAGLHATVFSDVLKHPALTRNKPVTDKNMRCNPWMFLLLCLVTSQSDSHSSIFPQTFTSTPIRLVIATCLVSH